jgi:hypothetical protein
VDDEVAAGHRLLPLAGGADVAGEDARRLVGDQVDAAHLGAALA